MRSKKEKFFYAEQQAGMYDETIELAVPEYKLIHDTLIQWLHLYFKYKLGVSNLNSIKGTIIDIGAGTGTESIKILEEFPNINVIAIDFCKPMEKLYEKRYNKKINSKKKRYNYICDDFLSENINFRTLTSIAQKEDSEIIGVISAYCIHHSDFETKKEFYKKMLSLIPIKGFVANLDLFSYNSIVFKKMAHNFDINYITTQFSSPDSKFVNSIKVPANTRSSLSQLWINHMNNDNILDSVEDQLEILKDLGLSDSECIFRYFQQGLICGFR